jgi:hypothetical protein
MRVPFLLLCAALVLSACGDDGSSTTASTTTGATSLSSTTAPSATSTTAGATTTTRPVWPAARGVVIGTSDGLIGIDEAGTRTTLASGPVATVAVAPDGTVFFQRVSILFGRTERTTAADTRLLAYDRASRAVREVLVPAPGADSWAGALHLDDVAIIDGRVQLLLRRSRFDPAQNSELRRWDESFRRDLETGAETGVRRVGLWETNATRISFGGDLIAHSNRSEDERRSVLVDLAGNAANRFPALVPTEYCTDQRPACADALTISPAGTRLAWIESPDPFGSPERRWNLIVADTAAGTRVASVALPPGNAETVIFFAADDRIVVSRFPWADAASTAPRTGVVDVRAGTYTALTPAGYAVPGR